APHVIEHVFEPFFTTKESGRGTGLGLSMVYAFIRQSRGHVKIYSEVGHGTSIRLYLPRTASAFSMVGLEPAAAAPQQSGHETGLVVEDDAAVRTVATNILEGLGYQVLQADDGDAALAILDAPGPIHLLFTDLVLPNGMSGQDLLRQAWERRPGLKALFTSGYSANFVAASGAAETVPLLGKPYRKQKLAEAVRGVLDASDCPSIKCDSPPPACRGRAQPSRGMTVSLLDQTGLGVHGHLQRARDLHARLGQVIVDGEGAAAADLDGVGDEGRVGRWRRHLRAAGQRELLLPEVDHAFEIHLPRAGDLARGRHLAGGAARVEIEDEAGERTVVRRHEVPTGRAFDIHAGSGAGDEEGHAVADEGR